ncbi:MAG: RsmB/NOP family class I SAM-dependent RNA methyltransferase [Rhodobacteraceae bacterium]|nr:RsmB/NOP family class I SAM-dependent RNA methyltransferase [Paracoccaceae bacterium]
MTPAARLSAAIGLLDLIAAGEAAEAALLRWSRGARYAGSGDRAAVRDLVFDVLRRWWSSAALGGAESGRGRILGLLRARGEDPGALLTGEGHAPAPLSPEEAAHLARLPVLPAQAALDCPEWLLPELERSLADHLAPVAEALRHRAPVFLRVNTARTSRAEAATRLADEGIMASPHPLAETALEVSAGARRVQGSAAYAEGLVELQDAASQAVVLRLRPGPGPWLDYCAGGGGKALALAARPDAPAEILVHDAEARRMADIPARAARAGAHLRTLATAPGAGAFGLVLCDAPCSGSGAWRRSPEAKLRLTSARLAELCATQAAILDAAAPLVARNGVLAYATCSLLDVENSGAIAGFLARNPGWTEADRLHLTPLDGGDGFFVAQLMRA